MMAKGPRRCCSSRPATRDLDVAFAKLQEHGAEIVEKPTEQPYGLRNCSVRDPAGNMIKIQQLR